MAQIRTTLDIADVPVAQRQGYLAYRTPDGADYCYNYDNIDRERGIVVSKNADRDSTVEVTSRADPCYHFTTVLFYSDASKTNLVPSGPDLQFDYAIAPNHHSVTIYDRVFSKNGAVADFYFSIVAVDTRNNRQIYCDPTIHNIPI